jgi:plasmid stability protein
VAAFHLRNIPDDLYAALRERAAREGRSMNAEILEIRERELSRPSPEEVKRRLHELRAAIKLPPDAPKPEELIRETRDSRYGSPWRECARPSPRGSE